MAKRGQKCAALEDLLLATATKNAFELPQLLPYQQQRAGLFLDYFYDKAHEAWEDVSPPPSSAIGNFNSTTTAIAASDSVSDSDSDSDSDLESDDSDSESDVESESRAVAKAAQSALLLLVHQLAKECPEERNDNFLNMVKLLSSWLGKLLIDRLEIGEIDGRLAVLLYFAFINGCARNNVRAAATIAQIRSHCEDSINQQFTKSRQTQQTVKSSSITIARLSAVYVLPDIVISNKTLQLLRFDVRNAADLPVDFREAASKILQKTSIDEHSWQVQDPIGKESCRQSWQEQNRKQLHELIAQLKSSDDWR